MIKFKHCCRERTICWLEYILYQGALFTFTERLSSHDEKTYFKISKHQGILPSKCSNITQSLKTRTKKFTGFRHAAYLHDSEDPLLTELVKDDMFQGLSFEQWYKVFIEYAQVATLDGKEEEAQEVLKSAFHANIFYHSEEKSVALRLHMIGIYYVIGLISSFGYSHWKFRNCVRALPLVLQLSTFCKRYFSTVHSLFINVRYCMMLTIDSGPDAVMAFGKSLS